MVMRLIYLDQLVGRLGIVEEKSPSDLSRRRVITGFLAGTAVIFVCQACFVSWRCKSSAGRDDRNRKARPGCPSRGGI
jgi:hypothetical protein